MNADRLLALFEEISEAPYAISRLRRFILDLAVRGKLVEQDPEDEPAEELLGRIAEERFYQNKARKGQRQVQLADELIDDPFDIPQSWQWSKLAEVTRFSAGRTPARSESGFWSPGYFPWASIADMEDGEPLRKTKEMVSKLARDAVFRAEPEPAGTMIMSFKLTIGKMARLAIPAFHNEAIISIHPYLENLDPYLFKVIPMFAKAAQTKGAVKGATLNRDSVSRILIPLPPLAEQHRIVAKVDELMALCDQLEAARQERQQCRERLVAASLQRLNQPSDDQEAFHSDARFALQVLPSLTSTPAQIKQLRQTILNLAVRGKLVEQDPEDEPANQWLETFLADTNQTKRLTSKSQPGESRQSVTGNPLLPLSWAWVPLGRLLIVMDSGWSPQCENHPRSDINTWGVLKTTAVQPLSFDFMQHKELPAKHAPRPQHEAAEGDILITRAGPKNRVGISCVVDKTEPRLMISDKIIRIRLRDGLRSEYVALALNAGETRERIEDAKSGMAVMQMNISQGKLRSAPIPLPPLAEQHRIVAKVDELMDLCDQLEQQLRQAEQGRRGLLEAVLREALVEPQANLALQGRA